MTSGVYRLTFSSGADYIGKSVDIEARMKQHATALKSGKAAGPMQAEYEKSGMPDATILFICHPDHIDLVEALCISRMDPKLNTTRPADPFPGVTDITDVLEQLSRSTLSHVHEIFDLSRKYLNSQREIEELEEEVSNLKVIRTKREVDAEKDAEILQLREDLDQTRSNLHDALALLAYSNKPWWQKIF